LRGGAPSRRQPRGPYNDFSDKNALLAELAMVGFDRLREALTAAALYQGGRQLPVEEQVRGARRDLLRRPGAPDLAPPPRRRLPEPTLATDAAGTPHALVGNAEAVAALSAAGVEFLGREDTGGVEAANPGDPEEERAGARAPPADSAVVRTAPELRRATIANRDPPRRPSQERRRSRH
jgi:AcrR family transcriptional regulator